MEAGGETHRLPAKAALLLEALARRDGSILTREEIRDLLWPGGRVEFDQGINFLIRTVRRALDESAKEPRFIETLPKRGYRLIAPVVVEPRPAPDPGPTKGSDARVHSDVRVDSEARFHSEAQEAPGIAHTHPRRRIPAAALLLGAVLILLVLVGRPSDRLAVDLPLLAIVPLAGADASPATRAQGRLVVDALTTDFTETRLNEWRVLGPAATESITSDGSEAQAARRELGACLVLSGSLRDIDAERVVLFLQVIRTGDQAHLWARMDTTDTDGLVASALGSATQARLRLEQMADPATAGCPT